MRHHQRQRNINNILCCSIATALPILHIWLTPANLSRIQQQQLTPFNSNFRRQQQHCQPLPPATLRRQRAAAAANRHIANANADYAASSHIHRQQRQQSFAIPAIAAVSPSRRYRQACQATTTLPTITVNYRFSSQHHLAWGSPPPPQWRCWRSTPSTTTIPNSIPPPPPP